MRSRSICWRTACTRANARATSSLSGTRVRPLVQHQQVLRRVEELLVFVLAVQFDEAVRQVLEGGRGGERAVDEGAAAALRRDLAAHDRLRAVGGFEDGFDRGEVFAGSQEVLGGAAAKQQADGFDED